MEGLRKQNPRNRTKSKKMDVGTRDINPNLNDAPPKLLWTVSGCQDDQTSADAKIDGRNQGALTWALTSSLEHCKYNITYEELLNCARKKLKGKYTQIPSMATTHEKYFSAHFLGNGV